MSLLFVDLLLCPQFVHVHVAWLEGGQQCRPSGVPNSTRWAAGIVRHVDAHGYLLFSNSLCRGASVQVHVAWEEGGTAVLALRGTQTAHDGLQDVRIVRHNMSTHRDMSRPMSLCVSGLYMCMWLGWMGEQQCWLSWGPRRSKMGCTMSNSRGRTQTCT